MTKSKPKNSYWAGTGRYQEAGDALNKLIPASGACDQPRSRNKALDKFRRAQNCYYDLFNNGLCNRRAQFYQIFKVRSSDYGSYAHGYDWDRIDQRVAPLMDAIILEAVAEQFPRFVNNLKK